MTDAENINMLIIAKLLIANWVELYKDPTKLQKKLTHVTRLSKKTYFKENVYLDQKIFGKC